MEGRHNETLLVKYDPSTLKEDYVPDKYQERNKSLQYGRVIRRRDEIYDRVMAARANSVSRHFVKMLAEERKLGIVNSLEEEEDSPDLSRREVVTRSLGPYRLRSPVEIVETYGEGIYCISCDELSSVGCGKDRSSALADFIDSLSDTVELYAHKDEDNLSLDAVELKRNLNLRLLLE